jgi:hypothetical protein
MFDDVWRQSTMFAHLSFRCRPSVLRETGTCIVSTHHCANFYTHGHLRTKKPLKGAAQGISARTDQQLPAQEIAEEEEKKFWKIEISIIIKQRGTEEMEIERAICTNWKIAQKYY